ncbi:MAG TPA: glycosyltransferase family 39 protein [Candidatus Binatia bacterium]|nr:glycosyltransferase family 39 protein [Candidatus Binatia bacterium]
MPGDNSGVGRRTTKLPGNGTHQHSDDAASDNERLAPLASFLFLLAGVLRIIFHLLPTPIAWDASVYVGMAKAMATLGAGGLWEPLRPLVWPGMLTPFAGFNLITAAHVLQFVMGMGVVWLTYAIARDAFDEKTALWALAFVALAPMLLFYEHELLTEQPAVFFALLAVRFLQTNRAFLMGVAAALAFLTKFPEGLIVLAIAGAVACASRDVREFLHDGFLGAAGFALPVAVFLVLNWIWYQNPLASVLAANDVIATSGLWLYLAGPLFYVRTLLEHNIFLLFAVPGAIVSLRRERTMLAVTLVSVLVLGYWTLLPHKEVRFLTLVFPFIALLAARGWSLIQDYDAGKLKHVFIWMTLILIAVAGAQTLRWGLYYATYEGEKNPLLWEGVYPRVAQGLPLIVTSDPRVALFTDAKVVPLYYPLFPQNLTEGIGALAGGHTLLFSPCDTPCAPQDEPCLKNLQEFGRFLNATWTLQEIVPGDCPVMRYARP